MNKQQTLAAYLDAFDNVMESGVGDVHLDDLTICEPDAENCLTYTGMRDGTTIKHMSEEDLDREIAEASELWNAMIKALEDDNRSAIAKGIKAIEEYMETE